MAERRGPLAEPPPKDQAIPCAWWSHPVSCTNGWSASAAKPRTRAGNPGANDSAWLCRSRAAALPRASDRGCCANRRVAHPPASRTPRNSSARLVSESRRGRWTLTGSDRGQDGRVVSSSGVKVSGNRIAGNRLGLFLVNSRGSLDRKRRSRRGREPSLGRPGQPGRPALEWLAGNRPWDGTHGLE